jgi:hypothetical protein
MKYLKEEKVLMLLELQFVRKLFYFLLQTVEIELELLLDFEMIANLCLGLLNGLFKNLIVLLADVAE